MKCEHCGKENKPMVKSFLESKVTPNFEPIDDDSSDQDDIAAQLELLDELKKKIAQSTAGRFQKPTME